MPDLSSSPDDYASSDAYAHAMATMAAHDVDARWAIGGEGDLDLFETQYAVEPQPGDCARGHDNELAGVIEELPIYAAGARIITRQIRYGPWRYVTPDEIQDECRAHAEPCPDEFSEDD